MAREEDDVILLQGISVGAPQILIPWLNETSSAFSILLPWKYTDSTPNTLGSYLIHPSVDQPQLLEAIISNEILDDSFIGRHLIDERALALLRKGRFDEFVDYRTREMAMAIGNRVQSMARWGFRDHGELPRIADDDEYSDRYSDEY